MKDRWSISGLLRMTDGDNHVLDGARLLVVEDSFVVADALRWELSTFGAAEVATSPSVEQALEQIDGGEFHAALLDVNLGGESVLPVADRLRQRGVPFVFVTGYSEADMLEGRYAEVARFEKPISAERIVPELAAMIAEAK